MLKKYAYHSMLLCLLGKHEWKNIRRWYVLVDNNAMMTKIDYDEALKVEFHMVIHSEGFGFNRNFSIKVSTCEYHNKDHNGVSNQGNVKMDLHLYFSDDSAQNADTRFQHMKKFIHWMYENDLFIKDVIIYDTTYGCSKQFICSNSTRMLSALVFIYRVIIYG